MSWQLRRDFSSLFNRASDVNDYFDPIDGLRAIASLLILSCHLVTIFSALIPSYPAIEWQQFLRSGAFALSPVMAYALEIFFMLSGFLLTHKQILQWNKSEASVHLFLRQYPILILKRALRFWPGMLLSTAVMFVCGEPRYPNSSCLFELLRHLSVWMFFQNYIDVEYWLASLAPLWSISLDMQVHIILPLVLYLFYSCRKYISVYYSLVLLLILSVILSMIVYNPTTMPIVLITYRHHILSLLLPAHFFLWLETNSNFTFPFRFPQSNPMKLFLHKMYLPLEARFGSFIIGAVLATQIINSPPQSGKKRPFKKCIFLGLICFYVLSPMAQSADVPPPLPDLVLTLFIASSRQIFAICQAFILFTALCPSSHPYHSPWIKRFLSSSKWLSISKLSYLVYLIHWRISFELMFGGPLMFLKTYSVTYAVIISLPIVLFISQLISCIWYVIIEKPIQRLVNQYFNSWESPKIHLR